MTTTTQKTAPASFSSHARISKTALLAFLPLLLWAANVGSLCSQTVTWTGGNTFGSWANTNNWDTKTVPLNAGTTNYTVIVPDANSLSFDVAGGGSIDALSFGVASQMLVTNGQSLTVNGVAFLKGQIQARGAGSAFTATANTVILSSNPQFFATNGGAIRLGSSSYTWDRPVGNATLLTAVGTNSLVDLHGVTSMLLSANNNPTYYMAARSNGVIDLSSLGNLAGPGGSGVLQLDMETGGQIKLDSVRQLRPNLRLNIGLPSYQFPQVVSMDSVILSQTSPGEILATNLATAINSTLSTATGGVIRLPNLATITDSTLTITNASTFLAPQLWSMDNVPLNISGSGSFQATNLVSYVNSSIPIYPGRDFESGLLTNIYSSIITVSNGASFRIGANSYEMSPGGYYTYSPMTLFSSSGTGSLLDLSSLKTVRVYGVNVAFDTVINNWRGDWTYYITAANQGTVDLSGLQTVYGANPNAYNGGDDWLSFKVENGGTLMLPNLKVVTQRTRFDLFTPQFSLPALESADHTLFNLQGGGRVDLPNLTNYNTSGITFGFNSTFSAPKLRTFVNGDLNLVPGQILATPAFTNIDWSRLSVSSGATLGVAAQSYQAPGGISATVFSANGAGSLLILSTIGLLNTVSNDNGHTYTVAANNNGVVNLSGLQTIDAGGDSWVFSMQNGGNVLLNGLQQSSGSVAFQLGDGAILDAPNLKRLAEGVSISFGAGSAFNAPNLLEFVNSDLTIPGPTSFTSAALTNIYASRLAVKGGSVLHVAAQQYEIPPYGYYVYPGSPARLAADGNGSLLDLSSLLSIRIYGVNVGWDPLRNSWYGDWDFTANASNQGIIDLSALQTIYGADPNNYNGGDDWFSCNARSGGLIRFGNVSAYQRARFSAADPNSVLDFAGLYLKPTAAISVGPGAKLRIRGDFKYETTAATGVAADLATVQMDGGGSQVLEVGGRDLGPAPASLQGNFGFGQLVVGNASQSSVVRLNDAINNGGRGAAGEPESLYLFGLGGQGLRILSGSQLLLGKINCYATISGLMVNLRSLIPAGSNSVAFDGGYIANYAGPAITNMTPSTAITPSVSSVDVSFNIPIQAASFTTADVQITGPLGPVSASGVTLVSGNTWRISFPAQSADGTYSVRVGPNINELAANLQGMDQNGDGLTSNGAGDVFTGAFIIDGSAPAAVSAYALQGGNRVGLTFNEPVTVAFATNTSNYTVNGVAPTQAVLLTNGTMVSLTVPSLVGDSFSVAISNAADLLGNSTSQSLQGSILTMQSMVLGSPGSDPVEIGSSTPFDALTFQDVAGGSAIWNTVDRGRFTYETRTGDFDVRVRLEGLTRVGSYTQAGLMARDATNSNARFVFVNAEYGTSFNRHIASYRQTAGGGVAYWPNGGWTNEVAVPNAWMRLKREGDVFRAFCSTNGQAWTEYARITNALPQVLQVGLASSSVNNSAGQFTTAAYRNYSDLSPYIVTQPQSQTVSSGSQVVFGVSVLGMPSLGYQWFFNGLPVSGGTGALLTLGTASVTNAGDYRCMITNSYGSATSMVATLVVDGVGTGGFEGDLMPAPNGDNAVTISDWVKVGRLVAGLDTVLNSSELQRVDSAPRLSGTNLALGDGRLTVADWTQAGRYAAGLDPLTPAGGPSQAPAANITPAFALKSLGRSLVVSNAGAWRGSQIEVPVMLARAQGNENAVGFSITFDASRLTFVEARLGKDAVGAMLMANAQGVQDGRLGLALSMPVGQSLSGGTLEVARVRFAAITTGSAPLQLQDAPVVCQVADTLANALPTALSAGAIQIQEPPAFSSVQLLPGGGLQLMLTGVPGQQCNLQTSADLLNWTTISTHVLGDSPLPVTDPTAPAGPGRFYRLSPLQ